MSINLIRTADPAEIIDRINQLINNTNASNAAAIASAAPQRKRLISTFGGNYELAVHTSNGSTAVSGTNRWSITPPVAFRNLQFIFMNQAANNSGFPQQPGANLIQNTLTMETLFNSLISIYSPGQTAAPISTGGYPASVHPPSGLVVTNPYGPAYLPNTTINFRHYWTVGATQTVPFVRVVDTIHFNGDTVMLSTNDFIYGTTDKTGADYTFTFGSAGGAATATAYFYAPVAVVGEHIGTAMPVSILIGDSIAEGIGNSAPGTLIGQGWMGLALGAAGYPIFWNGGQNGQTASNVKLDTLGPYMAQFADNVFLSLGTNDIFVGSASLPTLQSNMLERVLSLQTPHTKVWLSTVQPQTTSTDTWTTVANQTLKSQENLRVAWNNFIMDLSSAGFTAYVNANSSYPGMFEVFDTRPYLECSSTGAPFVLGPKGQNTLGQYGYWNATGVIHGYTGDGIHPIGPIWSLMAPALPTNRIRAYPG